MEKVTPDEFVELIGSYYEAQDSNHICPDVYRGTVENFEDMLKTSAGKYGKRFIRDVHYAYEQFDGSNRGSRNKETFEAQIITAINTFINSCNEHSVLSAPIDATFYFHGGHLSVDFC